MNIEMQKEKTDAFRGMHHGEILLLPNAWDVASARVIRQAGFEAIATTSAGIAFTMGYPDGERISREEMLAVVSRIAEAVECRSLRTWRRDMEIGRKMLHAGASVLAAGAIGMNLRGCDR